MVIVCFVFLFKVTLAAKCQHVVFDRKVEIFAVHSGQLSLKHDLILVLIDIHAGTPSPPGYTVVVVGPADVAGKKPIYFLVQVPQVAEWVIANNTHNFKPPDFSSSLPSLTPDRLRGQREHGHIIKCESVPVKPEESLGFANKAMGCLSLNVD